MTRLASAVFLLLLTSTVVVVYAQDENAAPPPPPPAGGGDTTPAPTLETLSTAMVAGGRGDPILIDFRKLFPDVPPMVAMIDQLPTGGALFLSDGKTPLGTEEKSTANNKFVYRSRSDYPSDGEQQAVDTLTFRLLIGEAERYKGTVNIVVNNRRLDVRNYNLRAVDDTTPLEIALNVRDGRQKLTLESPVLVKVTIDKLPVSGCTLQQMDQTPITESGTAITDNLLRVRIVPEQGSAVGTRCDFTYSALRRNGVRSRSALVTVTRDAPHKPRVFDTKVTYQVDFDTSRSVELIGISGNSGHNITFVLTEIPTIGQLFDVATTSYEELPTKGIQQSDLPLTLYTGRKSRVVLVYKIVNPARLRDMEKLDPVFASFYVSDGAMISRTAKVTINLVRKQSPICGDTVIKPVFWDQPAKNVILNYSTPNGLRVQRLILLAGPTRPIGDLTYLMPVIGRPGVRKPLRRGNFFSDNNKQLQYLVRRENMRASGTDTFTFRVQTFNGMSCVGHVSFEVMQHDARRPPAGVSVRRELVRVNSITLLPMWGHANATLAPVAIRITSDPTIGELYRVSEATPYEPGLMYRVNRRGDQMTYCRRHNCAELLNERVRTGDVVKQVVLVAAKTMQSDTRIWLFYKSPMTSNFRNLKDRFEYVFIDANGKESTPQQVEIYFRKALKRVINIRYSAADVRRNQYFDQQAETRVVCVLSNETNQRVMIPQFDKYRRHGQREEFRLFQYKRDGNRVYNGDRLSNNSVGGVLGQWLDNENTVILIPTVRARQQRFQFRAVIYNTTSDGQLDLSTREEVRVVVTRENTVPVWSLEYITGQGRKDVYAGETSNIFLAAVDADDDLVSFRLGEGVKLGSLFYLKEAFGITTTEQVKTGALIRIPKGSFPRSELTLQYLTHGSSSWTYPMRDNFTIYADDGSGVLSEPLLFNISILGDKSGLSMQKPYELSLNFVGVAVVLAIGLVIFMVVMLKRRLQRRRQYMQVPQDVELS